MALAAVLAAALLALMSSGAQPETRPMQRSSFTGGAGYWLLAKDGGVFTFGDAKFFGANRNQGRDIVGLAATASGSGYWTADDDGDVFSYGDAPDYGSRPGPEIDDIVGFTARSQGDGYWMVSKDGAVYAFGGAKYYGGANTVKLTKPIVGISATASGNGYWLIASDGGVFAYGDAKFFGSTGGIKLNKPIVDFGPSPSGAGYRFIGNDGGVFSYGDAGFFGSTGAITLNKPIVGFSATATGKGYWLVGEDGGVFTFGDATFRGSTGGITLNAPIVAIVATPRIKVAPVAKDDTAVVNEDASVEIDVEGNDTHALPASVSIEKAPTNGTATVSGGKVIYTPNANYNGSDTFKYKLTDTVGHSGSATVSITVNSVNDAPTISDVANQSTTRNTATGPISVTVGDIDAGNVLTLSSSSSNTTLVPNANIALGGSGTSRTVTLTPASNQSGTSTITLTVTDGNGGSATDSFVLTVNDPPTITDVANQSTNEDTPTGALSFTVGDTETAAGSLIVTASSSNTALVPNANVVLGGSGASRTVTVTPAANLFGTSTITLSVSDGNGGTATDTFVLTVVSVNDVPTISNVADQSTNEDTPTAAIAGTIGDVDSSDVLTLTASSSNTTLVPNANIVVGGSGANRTVTITPVANLSGTSTITLTVDDANGGTASDTFVLTVMSVNDAPTITDIADQSTTRNTPTGPLSFTVGDVETPAGDLTLSGLSSNQTLVPDANITFGGSGANPTVSVTPASNQSGTATITVTVTDANSGSASDSFVLTVNNNPTISAMPDVKVSENSVTAALPFTVGDTETLAGDLVVTASSSDQGVVADAGLVLGGLGASRTITITPVTDASGPTTITITVDDGDGGTATQTFTLTVAVNDQPDPVDDNVSLVLALAGIDVLDNDLGLDDEPISVEIVAGSLAPTEGTAVVLGNQIQLLTALDGDGDDLISFQYKVTDGDGDFAVGTINVSLL